MKDPALHWLECQKTAVALWSTSPTKDDPTNKCFVSGERTLMNGQTVS
jgi:hypothetical protein